MTAFRFSAAGPAGIARGYRFNRWRLSRSMPGNGAIVPMAAKDSEQADENDKAATTNATIISVVQT